MATTATICFDEKFAMNCAMAYLAEIGANAKMTKEQFWKFANSKEGMEIAVNHAKEALQYLKDTNSTFNV